MAVKEMTPVKGNVNEITVFSLEAAEAVKDGMQFKLPKATEEYLVVVVANTAADAAHNITLKAPTKGSYAAADSDVTQEIAAGGYAVIRIESARYANTDGTVVLVPDNLAVKAAVLY